MGGQESHTALGMAEISTWPPKEMSKPSNTWKNSSDMGERRKKIRGSSGVSNRGDEEKDKFTDKELLDFLQAQNDKKIYTGKVIFRWSQQKHGWRLQETSRMGARKDVREAIVDAIRKSIEENSVKDE